MSKIHIYSRNLLANSIGYCVNLAGTLVTSWFAFHLLGDTRFGVWALIVSLTGYLGIADLGLRPALHRHLNWHLGRAEFKEANEIACTALAFFIVITVILFIVGTILGMIFQWLFPNTPIEYLTSVRIVVMIVSLSLGVSMIAAVFGALLQTHERYDLLAALDAAIAIVRTVLVVLALRMGFGLVGMASAVLVAVVIHLGIAYIISKRVFQQLQLRRLCARWDRLRELMRTGVPCLINGLGVRIILYTDALLISWLIGMREVGYYSLAAMLMVYGRTLIEKAGTVFDPEIQQSVARGDSTSLRYFVPVVSRVTTGLGVLVIVGAAVFGHEFLGLFYGSAVGEAAVQVLPFLGLAFLGSISGRAFHSLLVGTGKAKLVAGVKLTEALANVILSVLLVKIGSMGLQGVAMGTMIPMILLSGAVITIYGSRHIALKFRVFIRESVRYWLVCFILFGLACVAITQIPASPGWAWFVVKVGLAILAYAPILWFIVFPRTQREHIVGQFFARLRKDR